MEGFVGVHPTIKKVGFEDRGKISVYLEDGRILLAPLTRFPSIKKVPVRERNKYTIVNGTMLNIHACDEIFHVQDFLGLPQDYAYRG